VLDKNDFYSPFLVRFRPWFNNGLKTKTWKIDQTTWSLCYNSWFSWNGPKKEGWRLRDRGFLFRKRAAIVAKFQSGFSGNAEALGGRKTGW